MDAEQDVVGDLLNRVNTASFQASGTPFPLMGGSGGLKVVFLVNKSLRLGMKSKMEDVLLIN